MQRSISISIPLISNRPASPPRGAPGVRRKVASIAWAAALIAVGLGPASAMAEDGHAPAVTALRATDVLAIGANTKGRASKAGPELHTLYGEYQTFLRTSDTHRRGPSGFTSRNTLARIAAGYVVVDTAAEGDPKALASDLEALGLKNPAVFGRMVSGRLPLVAVPALEKLGSLRFARLAYAITLAGAVTSQGDTAMQADIARSTFGVDGAGVTVGALSDSFNCLGGAAAGVASGDLPAGIVVLEEGPCGSGATDEARALAEIVHDVAPGAAIAVHTALGGEANFAQGIVDLANAGARVITDDVLLLNEPMFQDGIIAQAVDQVKARGISYFSAAGNQGRTTYEAPFRRSGVFVDLGVGPEELHDFDPGAGVDTCQQITIPVGGTLRQVLQWDQPFFSVSGAPGSASDLDILLTDAACTATVVSGAGGNVGRDPVEFLPFTNNGPSTTFGIIILQLSGPNPGLMKTVNAGSGSITIDEFDTRTGTSWGHSAALGGLGVGAADYRETPAFGQSPPLIKDFSSAGGIPILFDTAGNRLATAEFRQQPDITAPDGGDTSFFGGSDPDGTGFPNFFGTSASAPHAAGVAALIAERNPSFAPDAVYSVVKGTAVDMDDPATAGFDTGFDFGTGVGLIQADRALPEVPTPTPATPPPGPRPPTTCDARGGCAVRLTCQDPTTACTSRVSVTVRASAVRLGREPSASARAPRRITFAAAVVNVPPRVTGIFQLPLTRDGRKIVRRGKVKRLRGRLEVRNTARSLVSNTPIIFRLRAFRPR